MEVELIPAYSAAVSRTQVAARREKLRGRIATLCDYLSTGAVLSSLVLVPLAFFPYAASQFLVPKAFLLQSLAVLAATASLVKLLAGQPLQLRRSPLDVPILVYLAVVVVGVLRAASRDAALFGPGDRSDGLVTLLSAVALYYVAYNLPAGGSLLRWGMTAVVAAGSLNALEGVFETFGFGVVGFSPEQGEIRVEAMTGNPIFLGGLLVIAIPLSVGLLVRDRGRSRPLWTFALGLMLAALYSSYSRGPWLGAAFGASALLLLAWRDVRPHWRWLLPPLVAAALFAVVLESGVVPRPMSPGAQESTAQPSAEDGNRLRPSGLERMKSDSSGSGRLFIWRAALEVVRDQPILGSGSGNLYMSITRYLPIEWQKRMPGVWVDKAHNAYLDTAASLGLPGLLAYLWLLGTFAWTVGRHLRRADPGGQRILLVVVASAWAGYLVHLFFLFDTLETLVVSWVLMGLALREISHGTASRSLQLRLPVPVRVPAVLAAVAGTALAIYWLAMPLVAEMYAQSASVAMQQHRIDASLGGFLKAAELNPSSTLLQIQASSALAVMAGGESDQRNARHLLDSAVRMLNRSIQRNPEFALLYRSRAELYTQYPNGERLGDALADFRRASDLYPNYYAAFAGVADVSRSLGLRSEAVAAERKLLEVNPSDRQLLGFLASDYAGSGRWREAIATWQQLIQLGGDSADVRLGMAQALSMAGQTEEAIAELDRAETMDPGNEQVAKMRQALHAGGR